MPRLISLAAGVLPEHPPEIVVEAGAKAGWPAVGLRIDGQAFDPPRVSRLRRSLDQAGVVALDAEVLWIRPGDFDAGLLTLVDIAVDLAARNLLVVSSDPDHAATADKFARICDHAAPAALPVSLEFGYFSQVHTLAAAVAIVAAVGSANGRVLVDPLHWSRSKGTLADVAAARPHLFHYAQFCDAVATAPEPADYPAILEEALDGRMMPGEGVLPLPALLEALPPGLPLSVELRSKALRDGHPDPVARALHVLEGTRRWLAVEGLA